MNTPKGLEVAPHGAAPRNGLAPRGPEWIVPTSYGFCYGLAEVDGRPYLCTLSAIIGSAWKPLMPADDIMVRIFDRWRDEPDVLVDFLTSVVLHAVREKGLAS